MTPIKKWTILDSQWVINQQWCKVRQDRVQLSNGIIIDDYFVNIRPEIALILAITPQQEVILVRQYRHGIQEILLELPAGTFEGDQENSLEAAQRELREETGYHSSQFIPLGILYDNPVKDQNKIHVFLALDALKVQEQDLDLTEDIEVMLVPIQDIKEKIIQGEICVAGTISAIFLGLNYLKLS